MQHRLMDLFPVCISLANWVVFGVTGILLVPRTTQGTLAASRSFLDPDLLDFVFFKVNLLAIKPYGHGDNGILLVLPTHLTLYC